MTLLAILIAIELLACVLTGREVARECRRVATQKRDLAVRHARERAVLARWEVECRHYLEQGENASCS